MGDHCLLIWILNPVEIVKKAWQEEINDIVDLYLESMQELFCIEKLKFRFLFLKKMK